MDWGNEFWLTRLLFQRGMALVYLIAFLVALNQFRPLLGERGLLPVPAFVRQVPFWDSPSLFYFCPKDIAFAIAAWVGILLSVLALSGMSERFGTFASAGIWAGLYLLYLSFVNVGQVFYGFGWESILLEAGFFCIFLGDVRVAPPVLVIWMLRWLLFRIMFGAGMIKLRGDSCWRDLTCLDYHYETQPMPNIWSAAFHWGPEWTHKAGVAFNHLVELIVPFALFGPWRVAAVAGVLTIVFQLLIMASGNLSWLNFLTLVIAFTTLNDRAWQAVLPLSVTPSGSSCLPLNAAVGFLAAMVGTLSIGPIRNLFSPYQVMNTANPYHLVGSYGAFGSITKERDEIIIEGTTDAAITPATVWRAYEFRGKPGDVRRRPPQIAPYHLRIDWLMWFAAMSSYQQHPWLLHFVQKLLQNDRATLSLLADNPFPDTPPRFIRADLYEYHLMSPAERRQTGLWWNRRRLGVYLPAVSLDSPGFRRVLEELHWQ